MLSKVANGSPTHQKDAHSRFRLLNRFTYLWMNSGEEWFTLFRGPSVCHCVMKCPAITINELFDYMARAVMILMRGKDITGAIGRVGP